MDAKSEGFKTFVSNRLFHNGVIEHMELKNNIFGALVSGADDVDENFEEN